MEGSHGSSTYLSQSDTLQDVTNFIDAPVEDVTKLIGCRRGHYPAGYHGPFTQIPIH
jgi:hypothetical protein